MAAGLLTHPSPRCVAEIRTEGLGGDGVGSGYLVAPGWVLTAAHVVRGKSSVRVWIDPEAILTADVEARVDQAAIPTFPRGDTDWALIPVPSHKPPPGFTPVTFGVLDRESTETVTVRALGLPSWGLVDVPATSTKPGDASDAKPTAVVNDSVVREVVAVAGEIIPASGQKAGRDRSHPRRQGVLTMTVLGAPTTPRRPLSEAGTAPGIKRPRSVWGGMSGAAVWANKTIVGVVKSERLNDAGAASLTVHAAPTLPNPDSEAATLTEAASDGSLEVWRSALPRLVSPLVVPTAPRRIATTHRRTALRLAPAMLSGRIDELADLEEFACGTGRWRWYRASAFAGKTALTAWWTASWEQTDAVVVACLLRRTVAQNTAEHVVRAWAEQLGSLSGLRDEDLKELRTLPADAAGITRLHELIEDAARNCPRLVLLVDGLDEYATTAQVPVAEWLPDGLTLPEGAGLVVTSRLGAPAGVPTDHPLHDHVRGLEPSPAAARIKELAEREIDTALQDPTRLDHRILGFLAAAGPLTNVDLAMLIQRAGYSVFASEIDTVWRRYLARTLIHDDDSGGYVFAHDELASSARAKCSGELASLRTLLGQWADEYRNRGWPPDTPTYLLTRYANVLAETSDKDRLLLLALDEDRQDRIRAVTGADEACLREIRTTQELFAAQAPIDLIPVGKLARRRDELTSTYRFVPIDLPALWVFVGDTARGIALARSLDEPAWVEAHTAMAKAALEAGSSQDLAGFHVGVGNSVVSQPSPGELTLQAFEEAAAGRPQFAWSILKDIPNPHIRADTMANLICSLERGGSTAAAQAMASDMAALANQLEADDDKLVFAAHTARAQALAGDTVGAIALASETWEQVKKGTDWSLREQVSWYCAEAAATAGDVPLALDVASSLFNSDQERNVKGQLLASLALPLARRGQHEDAHRLAHQAMDLTDQPQHLTLVAAAFAAVGDAAAAEEVARSLEDKDVATALTAIGAELARAGEITAARRMAEDAAFLSRSVRRGWIYGRDPVELALAGATDLAVACCGNDWDRAKVAGALAALGKFDVAISIARAIGDPDHRAMGVSWIAEELALAGFDEEAVLTVTSLPDSFIQTEGLWNVAVRVTSPLSHASNHALEALGQAAEDASSQVTERISVLETVSLERGVGPTNQLWMLHAIVAAASARLGMEERAGQFAELAVGFIEDWEARKLLPLLVSIGDLTRATRLAESADANEALGVALAQTGHLTEADRVARGMPQGEEREEVEAALGVAYAAQQDYEQAERIARNIHGHPRQLPPLLEALVKQKAACGDWADADSIAEVAGQHQRVSATVRTTLAVALLDSPGGLANSLTVARSIPSGDTRSQALKALAEASLTAGNTDQARSLVAEAWIVGDWLTPLSTAEACQPGATVEIAAPRIGVDTANVQ